VIEEAPNVLLWGELLDTWRTLTGMLANYHADGEGYQTVVAARHVVEVEMRAQGYQAEWAHLTHARPLARKAGAA
jgi:hypothetical protein